MVANNGKANGTVNSREEEYLLFLESKITVNERTGFHVDLGQLHESLFYHQKVTVQWALKLGRGLIAKSFGLGKTRDNIEICRQVLARHGGKALIVCPLGVKHQFQEEDGPAMGTDWQYVRTDAEIEAATSPYLITNYERVRDGDIDPRKHNFTVVGLDEGAVLRSLGSKTYNVFEVLFADVPFRYVFTAVPSPNNYKELIYYARFLGIMDTGQALTRWFKRDSQKAGNLTLYKQHEKEFWLWISSWALFIFKPSDVGGDDTGYDLPELKVHWHRVPVDHRRAWGQTDGRGQARLFLNAANGVTEASQEKRYTMQARLEKMLQIMATHDPATHWLLWHDLEDERRAIEKAVDGAVTVYGSQPLEERESRIIGFGRGEFLILATKPRIAGSGCNFQRFCRDAIYLGVGYKFADFIQSVHRIYRFLQQGEVNVHIIFAESEDDIVNVLQRKWRQHDKLVARMRRIVQKYGLSNEALRQDLKRKIGVTRQEHKSRLFTAVNNDCILELLRIPDNSIDMIHTSPPFGPLYEYTIQLEDAGHNPSYAAFWQQMDFCIPELLRVLKPGRIAAIHVKDQVLYGHKTPHGFMEIEPFTADCITAFRKHGFLYAGKHYIATDVVRENNSTYRLGYSEMCRDATKMGAGLGEELLLFRKAPSDSTNARADEPVTKSKDEYSLGRWQIDTHAPWRTNGNRLLRPEELAQYIPNQVSKIYALEQLHEPYDHERHVAICDALEARGHLPKDFMLLAPKVTRSEDDPIWDDIIYMRTLNSQQTQGRREKHVCPLPFDIVERVIRLYSNRGELVLDPFFGLGTVGYCAIKLGRRAYGIDLSSEYWGHSIRYCADMERQILAPTLFDFIEQQAEEVRDAQ